MSPASTVSLYSILKVAKAANEGKLSPLSWTLLTFARDHDVPFVGASGAFLVSAAIGGCTEKV